MNIAMFIAMQTEGAAKQGAFSPMTILMLVAVVAVFWLMIFRPQQKQQKELAKFRSELQKGSKVVTAGGIHGTVKEVNANTVILEIDKNVAIEVDKTMIVRAPGA